MDTESIDPEEACGMGMREGRGGMGEHTGFARLSGVHMDTPARQPDVSSQMLLQAGRLGPPIPGMMNGWKETKRQQRGSAATGEPGGKANREVSRH